MLNSDRTQWWLPWYRSARKSLRALTPPSRHVGRGREAGGRPLGESVGLCVPGVCVQCALL